MQQLRRYFSPRLWPWLSLALGVVSAILMDRRPERAWLVVAGTALSWAGLLACLILPRVVKTKQSRWPKWLVSTLLYSSKQAVQNPVQLALFFSLPFYVQAFAYTLGHLIFLTLLCFASLLTLWEPWFQEVLSHPWAGQMLMSFAGFVGLNNVLPLMGFANQTSLWIAAIATTIFVPLATALGARRRKRRATLVRSLAMALPLPALLLLGIMRHSVPAAPLRLLGAAVGTRIQSRTLQDPSDSFPVRPDQLVCFSSIWAPRGLSDQLFHTWLHNGVVVDHIALTIEGGREGGFRTWSVKENLGEFPQGRWECRIETAAGQVVGMRFFDIEQTYQ